MRLNSVKQKVHNGGVSIGTFMFEFNTPGVGRIAAEAGAEFAVFDMEHAGWRIESIKMLIATTRSSDMIPYVRIPAVDGIDVLWIGHFDLTNSLGIPGQSDHPQFQEAVATVLAACRKHGKVPGMMAGAINEGKSLLDQGFRMLAYGGDLWLYQHAVRAEVTALMEHAAK